MEWNSRRRNAKHRRNSVGFHCVRNVVSAVWSGVLGRWRGVLNKGRSSTHDRSMMLAKGRLVQRAYRRLTADSSSWYESLRSLRKCIYGVFFTREFCLVLLLSHPTCAAVIVVFTRVSSFVHCATFRQACQRSFSSFLMGSNCMHHSTDAKTISKLSIFMLD